MLRWNDVPRMSRIFFVPKIVTFPQFQVYLGKTKQAKQMISLLLLDMMSYRRVQRERRIIVIRSHSLWSAIQLPAQVVKSQALHEYRSMLHISQGVNDELDNQRTSWRLRSSRFAHRNPRNRECGRWTSPGVDSSALRERH